MTTYETEESAAVGREESEKGIFKRKSGSRLYGERSSQLPVSLSPARLGSGVLLGRFGHGAGGEVHPLSGSLIPFHWIVILLVPALVAFAFDVAIGEG